MVAGTDPVAWQRALPQVIDIAVSHRQLLFVLERNEDTSRTLFAADPVIGGRLAAHGTNLATLLGDPAVDTATRVRLGCSLGALLGPLLFLSQHYQDIPGDQLHEHLRRAIAVLLQDLTNP